MTQRDQHGENKRKTSSPWPIVSSSASSQSHQVFAPLSSSSTSSFSSMIPGQSYHSSDTHGQSQVQSQDRSSSGSSSGMASSQRMPKESSSSSMSSSAVKSTGHGKSRARVTMACVHCRQRKIRCDGQQPTCTTCMRLGRFCVYESISELENVITREKKRHSKEVKQNRLKSLQGIGVPMPAHHKIGMSQRHSSIHSSGGSGGEGSGSSSIIGAVRYAAASMGAIRDSRLGRQERNRPYSTVYPQTQVATHPPEQSQLQLPQPQLHRRGTGRRNASSSSVALHSSARKRGITLDVPPTSAAEEGMRRVDTGMPIPVTSLSQPTTPEATYSMHASMLSRELSSQQEPPPTEHIPLTTSTPFYNVTVHPSTLDREPPNVYRPSFGQDFDYTPSPTYPSADHSTSSRSSAGDVTLATSTSSINNPPAYAMQRFMTDQNEDLAAQLAVRRRSSFDVGDFWRRTSVADAAVANFFDRVIHARGARKSSAESVGQPSLQRFSVPESRSLASSSVVTATGHPSEAGDIYPPIYGNMHQVMHGSSGSVNLPYGGNIATSTPDHFVFPQHSQHYDRRNSEEQQQLQSFQQQQQWQQEERLHEMPPQLHLEQLPDFQNHRQHQPIHTGSSSGTGGLHTSDSHPMSAELAHTGFSYFTPPIPNIAPPPLPTPMTELSSNMFAMGAPSHLGGGNGNGGDYHIPSYFHEDPNQMHYHQQQQQQQQQQSMAAFVSSRHGSLSSNSIPEEEGEEEQAQ